MSGQSDDKPKGCCVEKQCNQRRPGPSNPPPVWADTRQELAESLPYYRAYQSGSYTVAPYTTDADLVRRARSGDADIHKDYLPYAYLLGGFGSQRDAWASDGKVIVSHGGGHAAAAAAADANVNASSSSTRHTLTSSQSRNDPRVAALISSYETGTPCILILGEDYPLHDFDLNCGFAVLGWYVITACWAEKEGDEMVRWKVRFQWLEQQGSPWWSSPAAATEGQPRPPWNPRIRTETRPASAESSEALVRSIAKRPAAHLSISDRLEKRAKVKRRRRSGRIPPKEPRRSSFTAEYWLRNTATTAKGKCKSCNTISPQVYTHGWTCLRPECPVGFWKFDKPPGDVLAFTDEFLQPFSPHLLKTVRIPFAVEPTEIRTSSVVDRTKGMFCRRCGRVSCREYLALHRCVHCEFEPARSSTIPHPSPRPRPRPAAGFEASHLLEDTFINPRFQIHVTRRLQGPFEVLTYELPEAMLGSKLHLIRMWNGPREGAATASEEVAAALPRDAAADEILAGLQDETVPLRRHELTMHRSCASGSKARLLTQMFTCNIGAAYKHSTATETQPLSEAPACILRAGESLMQQTRLVGAHLPSDAEFNELYPCAYMPGMKMNYHDDGEPGLAPVVSSLSLGDVTARMNFRLKKKFVVPQEDSCNEAIQPTSAHPRPPPTVLQAYRDHQRRAIQHSLRIAPHDRLVISLPLRHGTVVVQEGKALQECLEHAVVPDWQQQGRGGAEGGMRFAITARRIDAPPAKEGQAETSQVHAKTEIKHEPCE